MNLKEQTYVCVLAECGNITRAAERLFISQPALSIYISSLEKSLGIRLFERVGKKFVLTCAGELYVEKARKMLALKAEFDEALSEIAGGKRGRLRIGVQLRRETWLIPPVLARFKREYPDIEVMIREGNHGELMQMFEAYELDLVLMNGADIKSGMQSQELFSEELLVAVPPPESAQRKSSVGGGLPLQTPGAEVAERAGHHSPLSGAEPSGGGGSGLQEGRRDARQN